MPAKDVFEWHTREGALQRLIPPWSNVDVLSHEGVKPGSETELRIYLGPISIRWVAEHTEVDPARLMFTDRQVKGPFGRWDHTHRVSAEGPERSRLEDEIEYKLPLGGIGGWFFERRVRRQLARQFQYRHRTAVDDLGLHAKYAPERPLRVAVSGSTGFVGSRLVHFLRAGGHEVQRIMRGGPQSSESDIYWDYLEGKIDLERLEGMDAVIHLAGESVLAPRWSHQKKMEIIGSRVRGTEHLSRSLASLDAPPKVFLSASAIGYYGNRGTEPLDESSPPGDDGFLSALCQDWERASLTAAEAGIRTVQLRVGIVLSPRGGILNPLLVPFKLGLGGRYGGRNQYLSWIGMDDVLGSIYHLMSDESFEGPVNLTSSNPVTMTEFARTLGSVLSRPVFINMPPWLVRLVLGQVADDAALMSVRALPNRLEETGYTFLHPDLEEMLRHVLGHVR